MNKQSTKTNDSTPVTSWAQWFDQCADYYQDPRMKMAYYKNGKTGEPVSMEELSAIHEDVWKKIKATKKSTILDVGSGIGLFVQAFQERVQQIIGTDVSYNMVKDASKINPKGLFLQSDIAELPFKTKTFDRILCYSVFHYLKDDQHTQKTLKEFRRITKNDGLILIGDILHPKEDINTPSNNDSSLEKKNTGKWWPSCLNHSLPKKTFHPSFFIDYCKKNDFYCEILSQSIKEKNTAESRYDVIIRF